MLDYLKMRTAGKTSFKVNVSGLGTDHVNIAHIHDPDDYGNEQQ
ncbi:hypothetical protein GCM10010965_23410 [Caldalkalibacillus thermarum]|nr:hypothetical protein GCM10010965_23410 [Caldalkalibacillus thermarum]